MAGNNLKRLLRRLNGELIRDAILSLEGPIRLLDDQDQVVFENGAYLTSDQRDHFRSMDLEMNDEIIGKVSGLEDAGIIHRLLILFIEQEVNKKSLGNETLSLYREINLLYNLADRLGESSDVIPVAATALGEASRLIRSSCGTIMLTAADRGTLETVADFGDGLPESVSLSETEKSLIGLLFGTGKSEIINLVAEDERADSGSETVASLICAPLSVAEKSLGIIVLANDQPITYTASDLKLLQAVASQAAPALESAQRYEKAIVEARAREERLQRQIQELKIELDEKKQSERVAEITETDYFKTLRSQAADLRMLFDDSDKGA